MDTADTVVVDTVVSSLASMVAADTQANNQGAVDTAAAEAAVVAMQPHLACLEAVVIRHLTVSRQKRNVFSKWSIAIDLARYRTLN